MKQSLKRAGRAAVRGVARAVGWPYLPTRLNDHWVAVPTDQWLTLRLRYESYISDALKAALRPGDVFVDVGAHYGLWSQYAAKVVGPAGRVYACEPSPAYDTLARCAGRSRNLRPVRTGVGGADGDLTFFADGDGTSGSFVADVTTLNYDPRRPAIAPLTVPVRTLDSLVAEWGVRPAAVKVDVEGFELRVLDGAAGVLADRRAAWIVEVHPTQVRLSGGRPEAVGERLAAAGYDVRVIDRNPNSLYTLLATPTPRS